jgi:hypothetical protein
MARGTGSTRRARKGRRRATGLLLLTAKGDKMETEKEMVRDGFAWRYVRYDKAGRIHRR